ncbi:MAG: PP2C family protein-serine/threonine phosphatase [Armatimonadota bacterium]
MITAWKTDIGKRSENEDACLVLSDVETLIVVADGMGGLLSGARASSLAVETVRERFAWSGDPERSLSEALMAANRAVFSEPAEMGTTCTALAVRGGVLYYAHLGDSRAYLYRQEELSQFTLDHTFAAEKARSGEIGAEDARRSRFRNLITKALGIAPDVRPDTGRVELVPGDTILVCTDGLWAPIPDAKIAEILAVSPPQIACDRLVGEALSAGGTDNITVVVALC